MFATSEDRYHPPDVDSYSEIEREIASRKSEIRERARSLWAEIKSSFFATLSIKNVSKAVFVLLICAICLHQCYSQVTEYLKFSTRLQVSHNFPSSPLWLMPGLTICNKNRIRIDRLSEQMPDLGDELEAILANKSIADHHKVMSTAKQVVESYLNVSQVIWTSSMSQLNALSRGFLIKDINCNFLWGPQYNCENFRVIESFQDGPCNTMFYYGSILEALATGRALDTTTSLLGGVRKVNSFEDQELVEVILDFEPYQRLDLENDIGGRLVVHSTGHIGSIRDTSRRIKPGNSYDIIVRRSLTKRLPPPYKSMCRDYRRDGSKFFTEREGSFASIELDKTTCIRNCIVRLTTTKCNCWPVEVPYFDGDSMIENSGNYSMCPWNSDGVVQSHVSDSMYINCYKKFHSGCSKECRLGCVTEDYRQSVLHSAWPSRESFLIASSEEELAERYRLKKCCARLSIKYLEFMENQHVMLPSMTLTQLVSNIGGIVSALVGVSAITVYRFITRRILRCRY